VVSGAGLLVQRAAAVSVSAWLLAQRASSGAAAVAASAWRRAEQACSCAAVAASAWLRPQRDSSWAAVAASACLLVQRASSAAVAAGAGLLVQRAAAVTAGVRLLAQRATSGVADGEGGARSEERTSRQGSGVHDGRPAPAAGGQAHVPLHRDRRALRTSCPGGALHFRARQVTGRGCPQQRRAGGGPSPRPGR
jgi:hypothetical protein